MTASKNSNSILQYWPLFGVYVLSIFFAIYGESFQENPDFMALFMGFMLIIFGVTKLFSLQGFVMYFSKYDPLAYKSRTYAYLYPCIEVVLGLLFILNIWIIGISAITLTIYSIGLVGAVNALRNKENTRCVCLGVHFPLPFSKVIIIDSLFMIVMCLWMIYMVVTMDMSHMHHTM